MKHRTWRSGISGGLLCASRVREAGKTTVITNRVRYLIEEEGVNPALILVVTFSKAASVEMRERFEVLTGNKRLPIRFGTFHSLFFQILKAAYHYEAKDIVTAPLKYRFLEEALMETEYDDIEDKKEFLEDVEREISRIKGEGTDIEHYYSTTCPEEIFRQIYNGYQSRVQKNRYLDFDDMVMYTYELFRARPDILAAWQKRFSYILIDEFQDINRLQYENIRMLARPQNNLFIVGDDDQSIYGFRGARPDIMLSFPKEYADLKQVTISGNYRCRAQILEAAARLISHNKKRYGKQLEAMRGEGDAVHVSRYANVLSQADAVVQKIRAYLQEGTGPEEIAVLFRTARQMNVLSRKLMEYNIPFVMKDAMPNVFEHWIAKDLITYLKLAQGERDRSHFLKIANRPRRYISRAAFGAQDMSFGMLYEYYRDKPYMCERINTLQNDLFAMKTMTPYSALDYIYQVIGYHDFLCEYAAERNVSVGDWEEVVEELKEDASEFDTVQAWFAHIEEYGRQLEERRRFGGERRRYGGDRRRSGGEYRSHERGGSGPQGGNAEAAGDSGDDGRGVAIMTMHASKGLEFDVVFLPDLNEAVVPYQRSVEDGNLEEERRLLYVAMTRAREHLYLSYTAERFHKEMEPSRFIEEIRRKTN